MLGPIVYVDQSEVRDGRLEELKAAIKQLAAFVQANEPQILSYNAYFNEDGTRMTVVHSHSDPDSLEFHMKVAGPEFPKFAEFIRMISIDIYTEADAALVARLKQKAASLGDGVVRVHTPHAGFTKE